MAMISTGKEQEKPTPAPPRRGCLRTGPSFWKKLYKDEQSLCWTNASIVRKKSI